MGVLKRSGVTAAFPRSCVVFQGRLLGKADAYFSSFRRCNYPGIRAPNATPEIVYECARYSRYVFSH